MNGTDDPRNSNPADSTPGSASSTAGSPYAEAPYSEAPTGAPQSGPQAYGAPGAYGPAYPGYGAVPPPGPGVPNPGLALVLGFIPGVGAMYNGQFAKGLAHILIFGVLISLSDHVNWIFGLLVAGWYFYMVFDAYQTARAHRDGLQAPDPFGLNTIGERFGLNSGPNWSDFQAKPRPGAAPNAAPASGAAAPPSGSAYAGVPPQPDYRAGYRAGYGGSYGESGGPATAYETQNAGYVAGAQGTPYQTPYPDAQFRDTAGPVAAGPGSTAYQDPYTGYAGAPYAPGGGPGQPYSAPYAPPYPPYPGAAFAGTPSGGPVPFAFDPAMRSRSGLPSGAIWLIGLGVLALVGSVSHEAYWTGRYFAGGFVALLGVALLVQRLLSARGVYPAHTAAANWYVVRSIKAGVFLIVIGALMLMSQTDFRLWHHSWPYLLILFGLYQVAERVAYNRMLTDPPSWTASGQPSVAEAGAETYATQSAPAAKSSSSGMPSIRPRDGAHDDARNDARNDARDGERDGEGR